MASLSRDSRGSYRIGFSIDKNNRRGFRIGKVKPSVAESIKRHVELLVIAKENGQPLDPETASWLGRIGDKLTGKLAKVGLIAKRDDPEASEVPTLKSFIDAYITGRVDVKPRTVSNLEMSRDRLLAHFAADRTLESITAADADKWLVFMRGTCGYAETTTSRTIGVAQQFFTAARRGRLIQENPFEHLKRAPMDNPDRMFFVTRDMIDRIIEEAPSAEWRLIIALARYGAIRIPSELQELRWDDVLWSKNRFLVRSPKTEHHAGKGSRFVPLFPELLPHFEAAYHAAPEGSVYCVPKARDATVNLRTTFLRIAAKAGVEPWEKLFVNLRSSRETELAREYPLYKVCKWLGNSQSIAMKHYLQQTDEDFNLAAGIDVDADVSGAPVSRFSAPSPTRNSGEIGEVAGNAEKTASTGKQRQPVAMRGYPRQESEQPLEFIDETDVPESTGANLSRALKIVPFLTPDELTELIDRADAALRASVAG